MAVHACLVRQSYRQKQSFGFSGDRASLLLHRTFTKEVRQAAFLQRQSRFRRDQPHHPELFPGIRFCGRCRYGPTGLGIWNLGVVSARGKNQVPARVPGAAQSGLQVPARMVEVPFGVPVHCISRGGPKSQSRLIQHVPKSLRPCARLSGNGRVPASEAGLARSIRTVDRLLPNQTQVSRHNSANAEMRGFPNGDPELYLWSAAWRSDGLMASSGLWITLCKSGGQLLETNTLPLVQGRSSTMGPLAASNFSGIRDSSPFPLVGNEKTIREQQPRKVRYRDLVEEKAPPQRRRCRIT